MTHKVLVFSWKSWTRVILYTAFFFLFGWIWYLFISFCVTFVILTFVQNTDHLCFVQFTVYSLHTVCRNKITT